jgi:hypothetical protein
MEELAKVPELQCEQADHDRLSVCTRVTGLHRVFGGLSLSSFCWPLGGSGSDNNVPCSTQSP